MSDAGNSIVGNTIGVSNESDVTLDASELLG